MTKESDAFEQLNQRIAALQLGEGVTVEWNSQIPDPDSPTAPRQIDVLITNHDGKRTSIECRDRSSAQSVMWIEELAGRKISLGLDGMIAVSVNGFSSLARTKANRFGITLYDFDKLSDSEIASWGNAAHVEAIFVKFDILEITAGITKSSIGKLNADPTKTAFSYKQIDGFSAIQDALRDEVASKSGQPLQRNIDPADYAIDGQPLTLLRCDYAGSVVTQSASCTYAALVDAPGVPRALRSTHVQKFDHSISEALQHEGEAHLQLNVSNVHVPPNSILHEMRITFPVKTKVTKYELVGCKKMHSIANTIALNIIHKE